MRARVSSFLKWLIERLARGEVPVDGVQCSDAGNSTEAPAGGKPDPAAREIELPHVRPRWTNFR